MCVVISWCFKVLCLSGIIFFYTISFVTPEVSPPKSVDVHIGQFRVSERRRLYIPVALCH